MIKEVNVTVMVGDMERAVRFYTETLGFRLKIRYGDDFAQIQAPGAIIAVHPFVGGGSQPAGQNGLSIGLAVDDIDRTVADLKGKGVSFTRISDDGPVTLAFFSDPDGNPLYLSRSKWG